MEWFVNLPDGMAGIVFTVFSVLLGVGGLLVTRRWIARLQVVSHNDAVSYYLSTVAIFYGIMLGLIAVGVWEGYNNARSAVGLEAGALAALYRDVSGYPEPERSALQADLRDYTRYEIDVAWQLYRKGIVGRGGQERLWRFQDRLQAFEPRTDGQRALHSQSLVAFNDLVEKRSIRLDTVAAHLPRPLWHFVIMGAVLSFAVSWFFQFKCFAMHIWMTAFFAALLGMEIHLLLIMNNPYRGSIGISPQAFNFVYDMLMR